MGVLLACAGIELARAGAVLQSERDLTIGLVTAGATLSLKTGFGCLIGLATALCCGGFELLYKSIRAGELRAHVFRGVSAPLLSRYQPPDEEESQEERKVSHSQPREARQLAGTLTASAAAEMGSI